MKIIFHKGCLDGLAAAWAAFLVFGYTAEYIEGDYKELPGLEQFKGETVYLLDFSFKRDFFLKLKEVAKKVIVLDHHKTSHEEIGDLVHIDQTKSGAMLAWEHFHPSRPAPTAITLIQDRDLWKFEHPETKPFAAGLFSMIDGTLLSFISVMELQSVNSIIEHGEVISEAYNKDLNELLKGAYRSKLHGYDDIPFLNAPMKFASDAGHILSKDAPFAVIYQDVADGTKYSLRSNDGGADVSEIAKAMGGGGHKNAAGFFIAREVEND